jgi:membrane-anchored protein YejM (alkaline phosphatase superfamily)
VQVPPVVLRQSLLEHLDASSRKYERKFWVKDSAVCHSKGMDLIGLQAAERYTISSSVITFQIPTLRCKCRFYHVGMHERVLPCHCSACCFCSFFTRRLPLTCFVISSRQATGIGVLSLIYSVLSLIYSDLIASRATVPLLILF